MTKKVGIDLYEKNILFCLIRKKNLLCQKIILEKVKHNGERKKDD